MGEAEFYGEYVRVSAQYCLDLFRAAERFFAANSHVEEVIAEGRMLSEDDRGLMSAAFADAGRHCAASVESVRGFIHAHNGYPGQTLFVRGDDQVERLRRVTFCGERLATMTASLVPGDDLQEQIWADPEYTRLFTEMAELICLSVGWQRELALETHGEL